MAKSDGCCGNFGSLLPIFSKTKPNVANREENAWFNMVYFSFNFMYKYFSLFSVFYGKNCGCHGKSGFLPLVKQNHTLCQER